MKVQFTGWSDTKNVDMKLIPENDADKVLLTLLLDRKPRWYEGQNGDGSEELLFEPAGKGSD